jgi:DNA-binding transcriptional ArsR family regulator
MPKALPAVDLSGAVCCPSVALRELAEAEALDAALRLKALADPVRLRIVSLVLQRDPQGVRNLELVERLGLSDATISHHLGLLARAGLLRRERRQGAVGYWADRATLADLARVIDPSCC